ncbi:MAG TPA: glycosyltransferase family 2 protein [Terriglobia bacterium]
MGNNAPLVSVTIVTHNSESCLVRCLDSVLAQTWPSLEVIVVDNDSRDQTRAILARYQGRCEVIWNSENRGFAGGQNQAFRRARGEWILALNPDVLLTPDFVSSLVEAGSLDPTVGTVCGKLLRALPGLEIPTEPRLDSAGIYFTPTFRHFDRGANEPDGPAYNAPAYVFGATGAAALYRRTMVEDVSVEGEFYDEDFFFSREDADVAWRAQLLGWKCLYTPSAVGYHVRRVFPEVRRNLPSAINRHSVKNRFLMRMKNATLSLYLRNFVPATARDLGILAYCIVRERDSLAAFPFLLRNWSRVLAKRRIVQERHRRVRHRVSGTYIRHWFRFRPVTLPVPAALRRGGPEASSVGSQARPLLQVPTPGSESGSLR